MRVALKRAIYEVTLAYFIASEYKDFLRWADMPPGLEHEMRRIARSLGGKDKFPSQTLLKVMDAAAALSGELDPIWKAMGRQHKASWELVMSEFERKKRG